MASYEESLNVSKIKTFCLALLKLNYKSHLYLLEYMWPNSVVRYIQFNVCVIFLIFYTYQSLSNISIMSCESFECLCSSMKSFLKKNQRKFLRTLYQPYPKYLELSELRIQKRFKALILFYSKIHHVINIEKKNIAKYIIVPYCAFCNLLYKFLYHSFLFVTKAVCKNF